MGKVKQYVNKSWYLITSWSHRLANQEALRWQLEMQMDVGNDVTYDRIKQHLWTTLNGGQVVPGYVCHIVVIDSGPAAHEIIDMVMGF